MSPTSGSRASGSGISPHGCQSCCSGAAPESREFMRPPLAPHFPPHTNFGCKQQPNPAFQQQIREKSDSGINLLGSQAASTQQLGQLQPQALWTISHLQRWAVQPARSPTTLIICPTSRMFSTLGVKHVLLRAVHLFCSL